jgi:hypothetical protein
MRYILPTHADVNDLRTNSRTIGLNVRKGFDWQSLDEATLAGLLVRSSISSVTPSSTSADRRGRFCIARAGWARNDADAKTVGQSTCLTEQLTPSPPHVTPGLHRRSMRLSAIGFAETMFQASRQ